jgi:glycosyltransferase involved in cell wall biosynthesis
MVVNLMTHLDPQRFEVAAISLGDSEGWVLEQRLAEEGFSVWCLSKRPGFDPRIPFRIRRVVRQFRPHVVHSHLCAHYVFPSLIGSRPARHVTTVHLPGETHYRQIIHPLTRMAFRLGVIPVAVSHEVAEWVKRVCRVQNCLVIPNGIPIANYQRLSASRQAWRKEQGFKEEAVLFVCVARLEKQKNHAMLLEAFARGLTAQPYAHLLLVGDGACREGLELRARELRLPGRIHFLGQRSDVAEILGASDVFALASQNEGNPLALMEAMAAGLPVVATAVGGVPELIADQRTGLLVKPGDCHGLATAMLRLHQDVAMRRTLAAGAAQHAMQAFSADQMARAYTELYERIVTEGAHVAEGCGIEMATHYPN